MQDNSFWGSGWSFPPTFEASTKELKVTDKLININQSIDLILKTQTGERSMLPEFGADLRRFVFDNPNSVLTTEIEELVKYSLLHYEPRIIVDSVNAKVTEAKGSVMEISIHYTVRKTNSRHNHVYPFALKEGTNLGVNING